MSLDLSRLSEVGVSVAVTPDSRLVPGGDRMTEDMLRVAIARRFPGVTDVEIEWHWDHGYTIGGLDVPAHWVVMATGQNES